MDQVTTDYAICPKFEKTFAILGKKWNGLIIEVLLDNGPQRFVDIAAKIPQVSDRLLVERLKELEREGMVTREIYCKESNRSEYLLTKKGADLRQAMALIHQWGDKWLTDAECS